MAYSFGILLIFVSIFFAPARCSRVSSETSIPAQWRDSLSATWDYTVIRSDRETPDSTLEGYQSWALDQIIDGQGTINVCMRWGSNETLTKAARQKIEVQYRKTYNQWLNWLPGYDNFPFDRIKLNVVGWAAGKPSMVQGSTDGVPVHTGFIDADDGLPTCNPQCYQHQHASGNYSECPGGFKSRYHQYLLLDPTWGDMDMGAAGGPGVRISLWGWQHVGSRLGNWSMLVHELGHTFGFVDFLDDGLRNHSICENLWMPPNAPAEFVMKPGDRGAHVPQVTEFEGWMLRYWWSRFSRLRGWQKGHTTYPPAPSCSASALSFKARRNHHRSGRDRPQTNGPTNA